MTLTVDELAAELPAAVGALLRGHVRPDRRFDDLYVGVMGETLALVRERYLAEVVEGPSTQGQFIVRHKLGGGRTWTSLKRTLPGWFPEEKARRAAAPAPLPAPVVSRDQPAGDNALVDAVVERTRAMAEASPLTMRQDVVRALNADPGFVKAFGEMTMIRYANLRARYRGRFPAPRGEKHNFAVLAEQIRELLVADPTLAAADVVAAMQKRHPRFDQQWLRRVRQEHPDLRYRLRRDRVPLDREADARRLAQAMAEHPDDSVMAVARRLGRTEPRFRAPRYAHNLIRDFRETTFTPAAERRSADPVRWGSAMRELFRLVTQVAPPGTTTEELARVVDHLVEERGGLPHRRLDDVYHRYRDALGDGYELPEARGSRLFREILLEYAAAAPRGTAEAEIVARVRRDYPTLTLSKLGRYRALWAGEGRPPVLVGQGKRLASPRYLGGWDPVRALGGDAEAERALAGASQVARLPLRLPLLEKVLDDITWKANRPLAHHNVLWVSHLLGSSYALSLALQRAGLAPTRSVVVGTPYGSNEAVRAALESDGFDVRVPPLDEKAYRAAVKQALDDMLKKDGSIVVMDDGGFVADLLHEPEYQHLDRPITIVEQTTSGIRKAEARTLRHPVINVAKSQSKAEEAGLIGRAVAEKVSQGLGRLGRQVAKAKVVVMGGGWVGSATAERLRAQGADVTVLDLHEETQRAANPGRKRLPDRAALLGAADIVIGATGTTSVSLADLRLLKDGAVVLSASSKRVELDMEGLTAAASRRRLVPPASPNVRLPTARYRLGGKELVVLGDGWPVNFDGDVEDIPADEIQLTRAAMLAGALQAASLRPQYFHNQRVIPFDAGVDARLLRAYRALRRGKAPGPIGDPDRWREVVTELAARF